MKHLKPKQYYADLYDRHTVEQCRFYLKRKTTKDPEKAHLEQIVTDLAIYFMSGERYRNKEKTIRECMNRDEALDKRLDEAQSSEINCLLCGTQMTVTHRDLLYSNDEVVLFMYECNKCGKARAFYENGKEFVSKMTDEEREKAKEDIDKTIADIKSKKEKFDRNFEKDRRRFCLSGKEGQEYISQQESLKHFSQMLEENEKQKVEEEENKKIQTLTFPQVKDLVTKVLESYKLTEIQFGQPEVDRNIKVSFTAIAEEEIDINKLSNGILEVLEGTNWKLVNKSLICKLGIVNGIIQGDE